MSSSAEVSLYEFTRHHPLRLPSVAVNHSPTPAFPARLPGEEREDAETQGCPRCCQAARWRSALAGRMGLGPADSGGRKKAQDAAPVSGMDLTPQPQTHVTGSRGGSMLVTWASSISTVDMGHLFAKARGSEDFGHWRPGSGRSTKSPSTGHPRLPLSLLVSKAGITGVTDYKA